MKTERQIPCYNALIVRVGELDVCRELRQLAPLPDSAPGVCKRDPRTLHLASHMQPSLSLRLSAMLGCRPVHYDQ